MLAIGVKESFLANEGNSLKELQDFIDKKPGWLFGHLSYDLKNEIEGFASARENRLGFRRYFSLSLKLSSGFRMVK